MLYNPIPLLFTIVLVSCQNYSIGDASRAYCTNATPETRALLKSMIAASHPELTLVDYCSMVGVPLVMAGMSLSAIVDTDWAE